jgi:hypothetical protein
LTAESVAAVLAKGRIHFSAMHITKYAACLIHRQRRIIVQLLFFYTCTRLTCV